MVMDNPTAATPRAPKDPDGYRQRFVHQRLIGWPLHYTLASTIISLSLACLLAISLGTMLLAYNAQIVEVQARYDNAGVMANMSSSQQQAAITSSSDSDLQADVWLSITQDMPAPVYLYYELSKFYGNHKRFVRSVSLQQLLHESPADSTCAPQQFAKTADGRTTQAQIKPCGLRAWSFFNDTFTAHLTTSEGLQQTTGTCGSLMAGLAAQNNHSRETPLHLDEDSILWRPISSSLYPKTQPENFNTIPALQGGGTLQSFQNPHFIEWMRLSSHPTTRKLYGVFNTDLKAGSCLRISILNRYNSYNYNAKKQIILSTRSPLRLGRNLFLGVLYVVIAGCLLLSAVGVLLGAAFSNRHVGHISQLSWNRVES